MMKSARDVTMPAVITVSGVAAVVNGQQITNQELVTNVLRNGGEPTLQSLILQTEVEQAAAKAHVSVTPAEIDERLHQTKEDFLMRSPGQTWANILATRGLSEAYARDQTRLELLVEKLAVGDQPPFTLNGKIHVYHILIATVQLPGGQGNHPDAQARQMIAQIQTQIQNHKLTFQQAAQKYSEDSSNAPAGGDLGWIGPNDPLDPAFKQAAFALKVGEISAPVRSQFGYHLIYLAQLGSQATPAQLKAASDATLQDRTRQLVPQYIQKLQGSAKVENLLIPTPPPATVANVTPNQPIIIHPRMTVPTRPGVPANGAGTGTPGATKTPPPSPPL
jgi:foldase protein PrsA